MSSSGRCKVLVGLGRRRGVEPRELASSTYCRDFSQKRLHSSPFLMQDGFSQSGLAHRLVWQPYQAPENKEFGIGVHWTSDFNMRPIIETDFQTGIGYSTDLEYQR
jgi:hypothetical protein